MKNSGLSSEIRAKFGCAAKSKIPKASLCTLPDVIVFYQTANDYIWENSFKF